MSQLLDSLRRASRLTSPREPAIRRPPPDAILATMGYSAASPGGGRITLLVVAGIVLVALAAYAFSVGALSPKGDSVRFRSAVAPADTDEGEPESLLPLARSKPAFDSSAPAGRFLAALELQREGHLQAAAGIYQELIASDELVAASRNNLGLIHQQQGDLAEAIRQFERALIRDPDYARAHNNLGVVLLAQGRIDAAAERFRRAARLDQRDPDAFVNLALARKAGGRTEEARDALLRALGLAPDSAPAHYNLAVLYDRAGEARRAMEHYRAFLDFFRAEHASRAADVRARLDVLDRSR